MNNINNTIYTITQISNQVKNLLEKKYEKIWVKGEVSSCKPYPSGHTYLTLKDSQSELSCIIFSKYASDIPILPKIGQIITVCGRFSLYTPKSNFQFQISNLYLSGQGELWLAFQHLKTKLYNEGLFDIEHKKSIKKIPQKIAIITSSKGAVLSDILHVLNRRAPYVQCFFYSVPVQGNNASSKLVEAINILNEFDGIDTIILARGGGSIEDLWCFNDESLIRAIFKSNIPIISAIGHENDYTLSDYVADLRAATPTAAAELIAEDHLEISQSLDKYFEKINMIISYKINYLYDNLNHYNKRHGLFIPKSIIIKMKETFLSINNRFKQVLYNNLYRKKVDYESCLNKIELLNPKLQLKRGFAIVTNIDKNIIYSLNNANINDVINIQIADGKFIAKIIEKENL